MAELLGPFPLRLMLNLTLSSAGQLFFEPVMLTNDCPNITASPPTAMTNAMLTDRTNRLRARCPSIYDLPLLTICPAICKSTDRGPVEATGLRIANRGTVKSLSFISTL